MELVVLELIPRQRCCRGRCCWEYAVGVVVLIMVGLAWESGRCDWGEGSWGPHVGGCGVGAGRGIGEATAHFIHPWIHPVFCLLVG